MVAALRRLTLLFLSAAAGVGAIAALGGLLFGSDTGRAVSVSFYIVGAFLIVLGFFAGNRGPLRAKSTDENEAISGMFGMGIALRGARRATMGEEQDSLATAAIFLCLGAWLIFLGIAVDASVELF